ncbi:unnamed protein product [Closterium sp. NIES-53]
MTGDVVGGADEEDRGCGVCVKWGCWRCVVAEGNVSVRTRRRASFFCGETADGRDVEGGGCEGEEGNDALAREVGEGGGGGSIVAGKVAKAGLEQLQADALRAAPCGPPVAPAALRAAPCGLPVAPRPRALPLLPCSPPLQPRAPPLAARPLRSKGEVPGVLTPWIRAVRLQLPERLRHDLPVLRLHSDRGGEFSSDLLQDFCRGEGILQLFTLPASPQKNGIAEHRIGLVMELNLWPRVSLPETLPTLRWTGKVGDASVFRVWVSRAFVHHTSADKLFARAIPCVFLGFPPDALGWQFYHPTSCRVLPSQDVTFDESVPFYRLFPYQSAPLPPPPLFLAPSPPSVDPLPLPGPAPLSASQVDPLSGIVPVEVAVDSGTAKGAASGGAASGGAELARADPGGAEPAGAESEGAGSRGVEPGGVEPGGTEPAGAEPWGAEPKGAESGSAESKGAESGGAEPGGSFDIKDSVSLFDLVSGAATAPPATADSATRSQWLSRDAAPRLAIRNHLPLAECAHFGQQRTAQALYAAVVARYSSPTTVALGRLLLPHLFPELSAFATVEDLVSHLRASDARYRAATPAEFLDRKQPPMFITLYFIVTRLPDSLCSHFLAVDTSAVAVGAARGTPHPPFFEGCPPSPLAPSYASTTVANVSVAEDVGAASASAKRLSSKGKGGKGGGGGSGGGEGGSGSNGGGSSGGCGGGGTGGGSGGSGGGGGGSGGSGGSGGNGNGGVGTGARRVELPRWADLLRSRIAIFDLDFDAIISTMHALSISAEGDCYRCVPLDPGIGAAALGGSDSGTLPGTEPAQALQTFTLDSGTSACFFCDSTTLTPLSTPVPVQLADHTEPGAAGARGTGTCGTGAEGAGAVGAGAVDPGAGGAGGTVRPRPYFVPPLQQVLGVPSSTGLTPPLLCPPPDQSQLPLQPASPLPAPSPYTKQSGGLTERREPASCPISPVCTAHCVPHSRPPPVPGTHAMALRPSCVPLRVPLPAPLESSLPEVPDPESDCAPAASPTVARLLATAVTDPSFESIAASALVAELLDFAAACRLDYATALVVDVGATLRFAFGLLSVCVHACVHGII